MLSNSIALLAFLPVAHDDGTVTIANINAPAAYWRDFLARAWEVCGGMPADVEGRLRCRAHLDALYRDAGKVRCWPTGSKQLGANLPAIYDGRRCCVRIGDTAVAVLLDHGVYHQGLMMSYRDDPLFGPVAEIAAPMVRFSARGSQVLQLRVSE